MKDLGFFHYFVEIVTSTHGLLLTQQKYICDIISCAGLTDIKEVAAPLEANAKLIIWDGSLLSDPAPYPQVVGNLIYLTVTGPELLLLFILLANLSLLLQSHCIALSSVSATYFDKGSDPFINWPLHPYCFLGFWLGWWHQGLVLYCRVLYFPWSVFHILKSKKQPVAFLSSAEA